MMILVMIRNIMASALRYLGVPLAMLCLPAYYWLGKHPGILATKAMAPGNDEEFAIENGPVVIVSFPIKN